MSSTDCSREVSRARSVAAESSNRGNDTCLTGATFIFAASRVVFQDCPCLIRR